MARAEKPPPTACVQLDDFEQPWMLAPAKDSTAAPTKPQQALVVVTQDVQAPNLSTPQAAAGSAPAKPQAKAAPAWMADLIRNKSGTKTGPPSDSSGSALRPRRKILKSEQELATGPRTYAQVLQAQCATAATAAEGAPHAVLDGVGIPVPIENGEFGQATADKDAPMGVSDDEYDEDESEFVPAKAPV